MKRCIILLMFCAPIVAFAQTDPVVVDTLDWHRYFPLQVGNIWEYSGQEASYFRREVVGDSILDGKFYFVLRETTFNGSRDDIIFARYDSMQTIAFLPDIAADTVMLPRAPPCEGFRDFAECIDLGAAFGDTLFVDEFSGYVHTVTGGYDSSWHSIDFAAIKCFVIALAYQSCYETDIGWVYGGSLASHSLHYAKIDGREHGTPFVSGVEEVESRPEPLVRVYPNPAVRWATISAESVGPSFMTINLFDALGRMVRDYGSVTAPVRLDLTGLSQGQYFVHVRGSELSTIVGLTVLAFE